MREELYDNFESPMRLMSGTPSGDVLQLSSDDNVAVALRALEAGRTVTAGALSVVAVRAIPTGHKIALRPIARGESILKYGQVMGRATEAIAAGEHVHVHNVEGLRGRGDLAEAAQR